MGLVIRVVASTVPAILSVFYGLSAYQNVIAGKSVLFENNLDILLFVIFLLFVLGLFVQKK